MVWEDEGDIYLDGQGAKGLVKACMRRRIKVNKQAKKRLKQEEKEPVYSNRELIGQKSDERMF